MDQIHTKPILLAYQVLSRQYLYRRARGGKLGAKVQQCYPLQPNVDGFWLERAAIGTEGRGNLPVQQEKQSST